MEFLLSRDGVISFLEVNTRLQVEHPVTEETTGIDIAVEQLRIAEGLPLSVRETPMPRGHALEFRINAEDPGRGYLPGPGRIGQFRPPSGPGVRLDSGVEAGSEVPGLYDSLLAKLIVHGPDRAVALARARRALEEFEITGVATVLPFHRAVLEDPAFVSETGLDVYTTWVETEGPALAPAPRVDPGEPALVMGYLEIDGRRHRFGLPAGMVGAQAPAAAPLAAPGGITAPIPGTLQSWLVPHGGSVRAGEAVAVMDAMKMETRIEAPAGGVLRHQVSEGAALAMGAVIATLE